MGYTHYWSHNGFNGEEWADICRFAADAIAATEVDIVAPSAIPGTAAHVGEDDIAFNGVEEDGHEDFFLSREAQSQFCKTARKPYDVVVVAVLLFCFTRCESFGLSSDGDIFGQDPTDKDDEYKAAHNLLHSIADVNQPIVAAS